MELRKVQRTSSGTFFVSVPKEWAERMGLDRNRVLAVSESVDGHLSLDPHHDAEDPQLSVTLRPSPYLDREIVSTYLLGYDVIRVEAQNRISPEERTLIKQASSRLIGLEIVEEDHARIILQSLLEPAAFPPERNLRREYNIAASMHHDAVSALLEKDMHLAKNVIARDDEVNRLYFLLVRILRTIIQKPSIGEKMGIRTIDCLDYRLCASLVEAIGDSSVEIARKIAAFRDAKISKEVIPLLTEFHSLIFGAQESALRAFFGRDVALAEAVRDERTEVGSMLHEIESLAERQPAESVPVTLNVTSLLHRIYGHSIDIADLVMPLEPSSAVG